MCVYISKIFMSNYYPIKYFTKSKNHKGLRNQDTVVVRITGSLNDLNPFFFSGVLQILRQRELGQGQCRGREMSQVFGFMSSKNSLIFLLEDGFI